MPGTAAGVGTVCRFPVRFDPPRGYGSGFMKGSRAQVSPFAFWDFCEFQRKAARYSDLMAATIPN